MTHAIILAAGQGTRLRPLTDNCPKCLVPLLGKTLLERQMEVLRACDVTDIHVIGGYCVEQIKMRGYACSVNANFASSNMVTTLFCAIPYLLGADDLLISYGDIIYQPENLRAVLECNLVESQDDIAIMIDKHWREYWELRFPDPLSDAETLMLDQENHIIELGKKPRSYADIQGQYTGLIKIRADRLQALVNFYNQLDRHASYDGKDFNNMYMTSFLQALINGGWKVKAVPVAHGWLEVDSVEDLNKYEQLAAQGELGRFYKL